MHNNIILYSDYYKMFFLQHRGRCRTDSLLAAVEIETRHCVSRVVYLLQYIYHYNVQRGSPTSSAPPSINFTCTHNIILI